MANTCRGCGGTTFRYNPTRRRKECAVCGTPVYDPQEEQQNIEYDRSYSLAIRNLSAGNWKKTIDILKPLTEQRPDDKKIYTAILRAATHDFEDINMDSADIKEIAFDAWDKLSRLGGIDGEMYEYSRRRVEKQREVLYAKRSRIITWLLVAAFLFILTGIAFSDECYAVGFLCMGGAGGCLYKALSMQPAKIIGQLTEDSYNNRSNPFK
ncbi:MAG: hypothetical protein LUF29_03040 [Oscillospiraceae bacterium]|nr:hypothetical protein [Oscillospiraceae bacterium]